MAKKAQRAAAANAANAANGDARPKKTRNPDIRYWVMGTVSTQDGRQEDVCLAVKTTIGKASAWYRENLLGYQRFYTHMRIVRMTPVQPRPPRTRKAKAAE